MRHAPACSDRRAAYNYPLHHRSNVCLSHSTGEAAMARVAREMVEKAGINVETLLKKLVAAAGAEFTTFYYYTILRVASIGMERA
jgi:hypothetical protein